MKPSRIPKDRNYLTSLVENCMSRTAKVEARIENALAQTATVVVTDTDADALATAIAGASDGDVIEVQTNAAYNPVVLPADKTLIIRAGQGYGPRFTGSRCIQIADGAECHLVSGFSFENYTTPNPNYNGAAIDFETRNSKITDVVFHNMSFGQVTAGSAVMLSYHWSEGGDNYAAPPQLNELSDTVSFVDCHFCESGAEGIEGGCLSLRAIAHPLILRCQINGEEKNSRGIQLQNCTDLLIRDCAARGFGGGNGEGIKIDSIGSPVAVRESGLVFNCICSECVEGIDIDDDADVVVLDNLCFGNTDEGISIDDSAKCLCVGNVCFDNGVGILAEAGSVTEMQYNSCFGNTTDYSILNGYALPSSNVTNANNAFRNTVARGIPYTVEDAADWAVSSPVTVAQALDRIADAVAGLLAAPIP